jgi:hypothetical protein
MEKLGDHGYVPMDHRELRFSFKQPRDLLHPDLSVASVQIARGDRQMLNEAKKHVNDLRRVWFFLTFPAVGAETKKMVKADLLVATPYGIMVIKVLDWASTCSTTPGEKWIEVRGDGTKVEHPNQLTELDQTTQWIRVFLEAKGACPKMLSSYVLFTSPHAKPNFTSDPRIVVGPAACAALVSSNGISNELAETKSYLEWGQATVSNVVSKIKKSAAQDGVDQKKEKPIDSSPLTIWNRLQTSLDSLPQFDLLLLRKNACYIFGKLEKFEDASGEKQGPARSLERLCSRNPLKRFHFEHTAGGMIGAPIAFVTGGLGWEPMCRIRACYVGPLDSAKRSTAVSSLDVQPRTRVVFRVFGCEGLVSAEVNDIEALELASVPRPLNVAEDGTSPDMVDQLGQMIGGVLTKSIHAGVKSMLPFPFNNVI